MQASCSTLTLLSEMGQDKTDDGLQNILVMCVSHSLSLWLDPCNWREKKPSTPSGNHAAKSRPASCKNNAERSAFHLKKSNYRKRFVVRLAVRRGSRQQLCVPEVFKPWLTKENIVVTQRKYLSSDWQASREAQEELELEKIAPLGETVAEGQHPALTHPALVFGLHAIPLKWDTQDDLCSAARRCEEDREWKSWHSRRTGRISQEDLGSCGLAKDLSPTRWVAAWTQRKHLLSSETPLGGKLNRRWSVVIRKGLEVISHSLPKPVQLVQADALSQAFNVSIFKSALTL